MSVNSHLTLGDNAMLVFVVILDRVLNGDDVPVAVLIDPVDHRGQGG